MSPDWRSVPGTDLSLEGGKHLSAQRGAYAGYTVERVETFRPKIAAQYRSPGMLFLGNIDPELQLDVLNQVERPSVVACDTMNFWIEGKREALWRVLERVDILIINDGEARLLGHNSNLVQVAKTILAKGPKHLIIKRGEYGVLLFNRQQVFGAPAFPLEQVKDPTGAGDTFCGRIYGISVRHGDVDRCVDPPGYCLRECHGLVYGRSL